MYKALLDTCVLWPSLQRDFLLSLAIEGAYAPVLSEGVLAELEVHEETKLVERGTCPRDEAGGRAAHLVSQMRGAFSEYIVTGWERLEGSFGLPDGNDEHVLAAAVMGGAGSIVTENLRDFPAERVPDGIEVVRAREFLYETVSLAPAAGVRAVHEMSARSGRNHAAQSPVEILDALDRLYSLQDSTHVIRRELGVPR